ncbi:bifunctional lysylphosphatidylglycerol flippase/synthetase MprF [Actinotalea fermentans]|uniref:Phosphatidylglycerol lysyltransferase C-terminal domain-containing protein n=1 Tax=Actinotalea fermentans TaxID=43671 RepID=A0A511Z1V4_9CELL|nr:phosphatidylglycerol lysyltransferase domain-containing protein [Actinotalea fermentans]KGM15798.1 hypothetical protein N867_05450 [Actinotalea fermentans ATCC 43279 = JCM 9966 = DSM 3133]GEN81424.1 hypothetical protein AFE02nite_31580 [Actinotalea fermentans]
MTRAIGPSQLPSGIRAHRRRVRTRALTARVMGVLGVLGLVSAVSRPAWRELRAVDALLPLVPGQPHLLSRTAGTTLVWVSVGLLLTSRGLRRGQRLAWAVTLALLGASTILHLTKGPDLAEAIATGLGAAWLARRREAFPVRPARAVVRRVLAWGLPVTGVVVGVSVGLSMLVRHDHGQAPRGLLLGEHLATPMATATVLALAGATLWVLASPHPPRRPTAAEHREERERARGVVQRWSAGTLDYFALRDDKDWYFSGDTLVAHTVRSGVCLVSPDPVGPPDERLGAWVDFLAHAEEHGWSVAVLGATAATVPMYEASGLRAVYLGDEAVVDCPDFSLDGRARRALRQAVHRVARAGCTTTFHDPAAVDADLRAQILAMCDDSRRGGAERGFSMTLSRLFDPADTGLLLAVTRNPAGRVEAFCQWVPAPGVDGWSLDVMRRRIADDVPNGVMDACVVATIAEVARRGQHGLSLNFAVLRERLEGAPTGPWSAQLRSMLLQMSERTQMASLSSFNEKFGPRWEPRFVVVDAVEFVATQALVMAGAEGVTEVPVLGRFLGPAGGQRAASSPASMNARARDAVSSASAPRSTTSAAAETAPKTRAVPRAASRTPRSSTAERSGASIAACSSRTRATHSGGRSTNES